MSNNTHEDYVFSRIGENLCLDFTNTIGGRGRDSVASLQDEHLTSYANLIIWGQQTGIISEVQAEQLQIKAQQQPAIAQAVLDKALVWREAIYHIFRALTDDFTPETSDIDILNQALSEVMQHSRLVANRFGFEWGWHDTVVFDRLLWPVVRSAADLLTSEQLSKTRVCASDNCGWLFLDLTRNHSRQWCDMKDCGNRAKARRHYQRKRTTPNPAIL